MSEGRPPAFQLYPGDFLASFRVRQMTSEQVGAFFLLLMESWLYHPQGYLPNDDSALAAMSKMGKRWVTHGACVRAMFEVDPENGLLYNERLLSELRRQRERSAQRRLAAESRWSRESPPGAQADARVESKKRRSPAQPRSDGAAVFDAAWWDDEDTEVSELAVRIAGIRLRTGRPAYPPAIWADALPRSATAALAARIAELAPDENVAESLLQAFAEYHESKTKSPYTRPIRALNDWLTRREPDWVRLKRTRSAPVPMSLESQYAGALRLIEEHND